MKHNIIKTIVKKELKDIFRDKKTMFMMVVLPMLLYPLLMFFGMQLGSMIGEKLSSTELRVGIDKRIEAKVSETIIEGMEERIQIVDVEAYEEALAKEEIQAYLSIDSSDKTRFVIYYDSAENISEVAKKEVEEALESYKEKQTKDMLQEAGLDVEAVLEPVYYESVDTADDEERAGYMLAMILPFILVISIVSSAIYPAIDIMAGEKERGTIETLLTLPISSTSLIVGKYIAVSIVAVLGAALNLVSIAASVGIVVVSAKEINGFSGQSMNFAFGEFVLPLIITIVTIFVFTLVIVAFSLSICTLAKTFKEAQNYTTPLMLLVMLPSYVTMIPTVELDSVTATIPVVNIVLLIKGALNFNYNLQLTAIVFVSNIALVLLALFILIKLFDSEEILFGSGQEFAVLQRRYNIQKGSIPTASDIILVYGIALLSLIYIGQWMQIRFGFVGIGFTQLMLVGIALFFAWYLKSDMKEVFSFKPVGILQLGAGFILWGGTFILMMVGANLMIPLSPENTEVVEQLAAQLSHDNLWINLLVVAILPAICEEMLFRGIIFKGLVSKGHIKRAIIISGLLFGLMHMNLIRMPITAMLGMVLAYSVYKTGSLFIAMFIHFLNNALAVVSERIDLSSIEWLANVDLPLAVWALIGIVLVGIGGVLLHKMRIKV